MQKHLYSRIGTAVATVALWAASALGAHALTISPPTIDHTLNPNDTQIDVVTVYNEGDTPITVYPTLYNFEAGDDELGNPHIYPADENHNDQALAPWITVNGAPIQLAPQERKSVQFTINVPDKDHATPGGHFGTVVFSTTPPNLDGSSNAVALAQQLGVLILVRVNGDVNEAATIAEFGLKDKVPYYLSRPVGMYVRVENNGNTHLRPTGNVFIKNMFGRQVAAPKVNGDFKSILPHSIRRFDFAWDGDGMARPDGFFPQVMHEWRNFAIGNYNAEMFLTYGSKGQILSAVKTFSVWPWHLLLLIIVLLALLVVIIWMWMRAHNRAIIRRYERGRR